MPDDFSDVQPMDHTHRSDSIRSESSYHRQQLATSRRSRSGCDTCKRRRVKCDEGKPVCRRCQRGHRQCTYTTTQRHPILIDPSWSSVAVSRSDRSPVSPQSVDSATLLERCHQYEATWFTPPFSPSGDNVTQSQTQLWAEEWRDFLSLAKELLKGEPLEVHLSNAFATVNMAAWFGDVNKSNEVFYLQELDTLLSGLRNRPPRQFDDVVMVCTVIVGHAECIRTADYAAGIYHLEAGFRIMAEWEEALSTLTGQARLERAQINNRIKAALSCNRIVCSVLNWPAEHKLHIGPSCSIGPLSQIPEWFHSVHMAANSVENFMLLWVTQLARGASWVEPLSDEIVARLCTQLQDRMATLSTGLLSSADFHMLYFLRSHCRIAMCIVAANRHRLEAAEEEEMELALTDLDWLMRNRSCWDLPGNRIRNSLGFIAPAFFVATHTRRLTLRSKALVFLKRLDVIEGAWNSHVAHRMAEGIIAVEDGLTPPADESSGLLKMTAASCAFSENEFGTLQTTVTMTFGQLPRTSLSGTWDCKLAEIEDREACMRCQWPLDAVVKSFGYFGGNCLPTPYLSTPAAIHDRLEAHKVEKCAAERCCGNMLLDTS